MLPKAPSRRSERRTYLAASAVPVERALLARAEALDAEVAAYEGSEWTPLADALALVRNEFRNLAEELHYW